MIEFLKSLRAMPSDQTFKRERWITVTEAQVIYDLMIDPKNNIGDYFECGTANGFSTCWATVALQRKTYSTWVHTWDPHDRPKVWDLPELNEAKRDIKFHLEKYTYSLPYWVDIERPLSPDSRALFFIDGDHRYHPARNDIRTTLRASQSGDIILLHDVKEYQGLRGMFDQFVKTNRTEFFDTERGMGAVWL